MTKKLTNKNVLVKICAQTLMHEKKNASALKNVHTLTFMPHVHMILNETLGNLY